MSRRGIAYGLFEVLVHFRWDKNYSGLFFYKLFLEKTFLISEIHFYEGKSGNTIHFSRGKFGCSLQFSRGKFFLLVLGALLFWSLVCLATKDSANVLCKKLDPLQNGGVESKGQTHWIVQKVVRDELQDIRFGSVGRTCACAVCSRVRQ